MNNQPALSHAMRLGVFTREAVRYGMRKLKPFVRAMLFVAALTVLPWLGLGLLMHTYLIVAVRADHKTKAESARFTVNGSPLDETGSFVYTGFFGSDDIECRFESGKVTRIRVFPRFFDDNSSSIFFSEDGEVRGYGDLRFVRLEERAAHSGLRSLRVGHSLRDEGGHVADRSHRPLGQDQGRPGTQPQEQVLLNIAEFDRVLPRAPSPLVLTGDVDSSVRELDRAWAKKVGLSRSRVVRPQVQQVPAPKELCAALVHGERYGNSQSNGEPRSPIERQRRKEGRDSSVGPVGDHVGAQPIQAPGAVDAHCHKVGEFQFNLKLDLLHQGQSSGVSAEAQTRA